MNLVHLKDRIESYKSRFANMRQHAKAGTKLVVHTAIAGATAAAVGAYDEAKGTAQENDPANIRTANIGPVPAALALAAIGKVGAFAQLGDETGELASAIGQGALDAWAYVEGRRLYAKHEQSK